MTYLDDLQIIKSALMEISKQSNGLAIGLQNAAPPKEVPPPSVCYLTETTEQLQDKLKQVNQLIDAL